MEKRLNGHNVAMMCTHLLLT